MIREQNEHHNAAIQAAIKQYDDASRKEQATKGDLKQLELQLQKEMKAMELRITTRFGAIIAASVAIVAALVKWL